MPVTSPVSLPAAVGTATPPSQATAPKSKESPTSEHVLTRDPATLPDGQSTAHATHAAGQSFKKIEEEGVDRLVGTSPTSADKPGVSSCTTLERASSETTEEAEPPANRVAEHAPPKPRSRLATSRPTTVSASPSTAPSTATKHGSGKLSDMQRVVQLLEQYVSARTIQQCAAASASTTTAASTAPCALSDTTESPSPTPTTTATAASPIPEWLEDARPLLSCVDSCVTVPLLALLQVDPLMAAVRAGLDSEKTRAAQPEGRGGHSVLQQICLLLEALRQSKQLVVRDDLPVREDGTAPTVLLPVDASELALFRVGPLSHAAPGVRCTLLLECAGEDATAAAELDALCASRLGTVLHDGAAEGVVVARRESRDCLAVTFTDQQLTREGFLQLQECAPYKAGHMTVRMRVTSQSPQTHNGRHSANARGGGAAHGLSGNVESVGTGHHRWPRTTPPSTLALTRALALARSAADRPEASARGSKTSAVPTPSPPLRFAATRAAAAATTSAMPACTLAPAPIDDDDSTPRLPPTTTTTTTTSAAAAAAAAAADTHSGGLNLAAAPFVPRALRGLGGSMDDFEFALGAPDNRTRMMTSATPPMAYGSRPPPPPPVWPVEMDDSERLAAQMLLDSQSGLLVDPFRGIVPPLIVPWEDAHSLSPPRPTSRTPVPSAHPSSSVPPAGAAVAPPAAAGRLGPAPVASCGSPLVARDSPLMRFGGTTATTTTTTRSTSPRSSAVVPVQPHAIDDEMTPPSASLSAAARPPQPPTPLTGDEQAASLPDSQMASSSSRRWRRHDPYSLVTATVETSAPSSPSQSLASDQPPQQRTPLCRGPLLTPGSATGGARYSPTFMDPMLRARERSRLSTNLSSLTASTDAVADMPSTSALLPHESSTSSSVRHDPPTGDRKTSARALTYAEVLQQGRHGGKSETTTEETQ